MNLIQTFSDDSQLFFDKGSFDDWCVYFKNTDKTVYAPTDIEYFTRLVELAEKYGPKKLYSHFLQFYRITTNQIDSRILHLINELARLYSEDRLEIEILFTILYAGMVAEENKANARLKKRIKRLGLHQVLIENMDPEMAANFSKGKKWQELDEICKLKGF